MERVAELYPVWKEAVDQFLRMKPEYGHVVTKVWLFEQFKILKPVTAQDQQDAELAFMKYFDRFRSEILENHKMDLKSLGRGNYKVVHPREQTSLALYSGTKDIGKAIKRMSRSIVYVNTEVLNDSERIEHANGLSKAATIQSMFNRRKLLGRK